VGQGDTGCQHQSGVGEIRCRLRCGAQAVSGAGQKPSATLLPYRRLSPAADKGCHATIAIWRPRLAACGALPPAHLSNYLAWNIKAGAKL
jgi:hypothetical protein